MVVAPGRMIDSFLSIPDAESLPLYLMVLKLACVCVFCSSSKFVRLLIFNHFMALFIVILPIPPPFYRVHEFFLFYYFQPISKMFSVTLDLFQGQYLFFPIRLAVLSTK